MTTDYRITAEGRLGQGSWRRKAAGTVESIEILKGLQARASGLHQHRGEDMLARPGGDSQGGSVPIIRP